MGTVLVLARETPYPPNAGDRVVTHGFVRGLVERGHAVHVLASGDPDAEPSGGANDRERAESLADRCASVALVPRSGSRLPPRLRTLRNHAAGRSDVMAMFESPSLAAAARERIRDLDPDAVLAEHPYVGQVFREPAVRRAAAAAGATLVTNAHVVEFAVHRRYRDLATGLGTRAELALETPRLRREELAVYEASDRVLVLGTEDRAELVDAGVSTPVATQHVALDAAAYDAGVADSDGIDPGPPQRSAVASGENPGATAVADGDGVASADGTDEASDGDESGVESSPPGGADLLFFGSYGWFPNEDAVTAFASAAWPRIRDARPDVRFVVAGRNAPDSVRALGDEPGVAFVGEVPDLGRAVRDAAAVVAPLRIGGGTRLKVLESMAWGAPVVATAAGFEGVDARPGADLAVASDWASFADEAVELLDSPERRTRLGRNARRRVEQVYALETATAELEASLGLGGSSR